MRDGRDVRSRAGDAVYGHFGQDGQSQSSTLRFATLGFANDLASDGHGVSQVRSLRLLAALGAQQALVDEWEAENGPFSEEELRPFLETAMRAQIESTMRSVAPQQAAST